MHRHMYVDRALAVCYHASRANLLVVAMIMLLIIYTDFRNNIKLHYATL